MRRAFVLLVLMLGVSGCAGLSVAVTPTVTVGAGPEVTGTTSTTAPVPNPGPRSCRPFVPSGQGLTTERITASGVVDGAIAVSRRVFDCADEVVVTSSENAAQFALAAQLAAARGGPLLVSAPGEVDLVEAEIVRLAPRRVTVVGSAGVPTVPEGVTLERSTGSLGDLARMVARETGAAARVHIGDAGPLAAADVLGSIASRRTVTIPNEGPPGDCGENRAGIAEAIERATPAITAGDVWLIDACSPLQAMTVAAALGPHGGTALLVDGRDLRAEESVVDTLRGWPDGGGRVRLVGEITNEADWQLRAVLSGAELPGGGLLLFPGKRIVALYGNPTTPALGVLGEQGPEEAADRARRVAEAYGADGTQIIPAFEIIATVASTKAEDDGDYSWELSVEEIRPWIEVAAREGLYVTLDLQPGRTDFLTQAQRYEELLALPHVGLALDPEWRLKPNQRHLRQIGTVDAAEVNQVIEYLAGLVRERGLPQKALILHQFKLSMITNRELIESPPELAVIVHADGQGPIHTKYDTYDVLTAQPDRDRWWWGWKNFYDEDSPTPTPAQVLDLEPLPVYVSYQ